MSAPSNPRNRQGDAEALAVALAPAACPVLKWAAQLRSPREDSGPDDAALLQSQKSPERARVGVLSHAGKRMLHRSVRSNHHHESSHYGQDPGIHRHLDGYICMGVYRDKIDKHWSGQEISSGRSATGASPALPRKMNPHPLRKFEDISSGALASPALPSHAVAPGSPLSPTVSNMPALGAAVASAAGPSPKVIGKRDEGTTAYIASVMASPTSGDITTEHLEAKHLGRLFDQWRSQQEQDQQATSALPMTTPRRGGNRDIIMGSLGSEREISAASRSLQRPEIFGAESSSISSRLPEEQARDISVEFSVMQQVDHDVACQKKVDRMFSVLTNPRTRRQVFAPKTRAAPGGGASTAFKSIDSHETTHIQGVPHLKVMELHKGIWRTEI